MTESGLNTQKKFPLLVILGPTASGKTHLAVRIAKVLKGEIISADSRQVYRDMSIGTGKDLEEYVVDGQAVPYHLIDVADAGEKYNVSRFQRDFSDVYADICGRGHIPIVCGGSGMYLDAVLRGHAFTAVPVDMEVREGLETLDMQALHEIFNAYSTSYSAVADTSTRKRLIRAIEISSFLSSHPDAEKWLAGKPVSYAAVCFGLNPQVEVRRERISSRLTHRLNNGLIEEVQALLARGLSAEQLVYYGLEYKYVTQFLTGQMDRTEMHARLETEIHRFAKRQMTFFRKMEKDGIRIHWLDGYSEIEEKTAFVLEQYISEVNKFEI